MAKPTICYFIRQSVCSFSLKDLVCQTFFSPYPSLALPLTPFLSALVMLVTALVWHILAGMGPRVVLYVVLLYMVLPNANAIFYIWHFTLPLV